ncbi:hypothetical protein [Nonomuraea sp. NPDC049129]|uniref:hypothetical protein n=1 Tax=Nonomuraea sp. NPDC049129 TaxID=3155272 RepID=UPI00340D6932
MRWGPAVELGADASLSELEGEAGATRLAEWFTGRWGGAAAATFNARTDALGSACAWWRDQDWLPGDPLRRRARTPDRTKALDRGQVEALLTRQTLPLRDRTLFRLLYESAAREEATADLPSGPYTLHQLRYSALTHAAEDGANTSTLLAYSGHTPVASLSRYARVSPEALARWQQGRDLAARRR